MTISINTIKRFRRFRVGALLIIPALGVSAALLSLMPGRALEQIAGDTASKPATPAAAATADGKEVSSKSMTLKGDTIWTDTGVTVEPGQHIVVTAEGKLRYSDAKEDNGPEGLARNFKDLIRILPDNAAGRGALLARIGDPDTAQPFVVGAHKDAVAPVGGKLFLGINQASVDTGDGSYTVKLEIFAGEGNAVREVAKEVTSMPGIDNTLFAKIPRRIADQQGNPGDMVNFLVLGDEAQMKQVFTSAGWVTVDASVESTILAGAIASFSKESYLTMPMSPLYLFGRHQDYGWAHAEPITVVASRNHLRIWRAPFTVDGRMAWIGAATHDIGFERDQRNNGLTHKIDPNIDLEREYVDKTLSSTGYVAEVMHFTPTNPMTEAHTATGGSFHSDGRVLILKLSEASATK